MEYMVEYKIKDKLLVAPLEDVSLEGLIGARCDVFIHERVSGKFARKPSFLERMINSAISSTAFGEANSGASLF